MVRKGYAAALVATFATTLPAWAGDSQLERDTLKGLRAIYVLVEEVGPEAERDGLTRSTVQTDVELKLRQAGIHVVNRIDALTVPGGAYLYVNINALRLTESPLYVYSIRVELDQDIVLGRERTIFSVAPTWSAAGGVVGIVPYTRLAPKVREWLRDITDQFVNAYLAVNPNRYPGGSGR